MILQSPFTPVLRPVLRGPFERPLGSLRDAVKAMFANGEPGYIYSTDMATLFQDAAGTIPVTGIEQRVGLRLDIKHGLQLGPELASTPLNGTIYAYDTFSVTGMTGFAGATSTAKIGGAVLSGQLVKIGMYYKVEVDVVAISGSHRISLAQDKSGAGTAAGSSTLLVTSPGKYSFIVSATGAVAYLQINNTGAFISSIEVASVSVRELPGNHAYQSTTTKQAYYSRRVNLLVNTSFAGGVSGSPGTAPTGWTQFVTAAPTITYSNGSVRCQLASGDRFQLGQAISVSSNTTYIVSINVDVISTCSVAQAFGFSSIPAGSTLSYTLDSVALANPNTPIPLGTHTLGIVLVVGGTSGSANLRIGAGVQGAVVTPADLSISNPSLTLAIDSHLPYQWVNTATDYDADPNKFPAYLRYDGGDDAYQTNTIDMTSTDKVLVAAGITKLSDAALGIVVENGNFATPLDGAFLLTAPNGASATLSFASRGTSANAGTATARPSPLTGALVGLGNIATDTSRLLLDGIQIADGAGDQGTGNYSNRPHNIGARAGTSAFFNGRDYGIICRGTQWTDQQLAIINSYLKQEMRLP